MKPINRFLLPGVVLLLTIGLATAQTNLNFRAGLQQHLSLQQHTFRLSLAPTAALQWGRHQLAAGPVLMLRDFNNATAKLPKLNGALLAYRYYLNKDASKLSIFYLEWSSKLHFVKERWHSNYWNVYQQAYVDEAHRSLELLWSNSVSAGHQLRLAPRWWLQSSAGAGYYWSDMLRSGADRKLYDSTPDYRAYEPQHWGFLLQFGLQYQL